MYLEYVSASHGQTHVAYTLIAKLVTAPIDVFPKKGDATQILKNTFSASYSCECSIEKDKTLIVARES
jgi:hypothetical protein